MEAVALAIAASYVLEKRVKREIDRYKKYSQNRGVMEALGKTVENVRKQLVLLQRKCEELRSKLSSEWDNDFLSSRFTNVKDNLESIDDRLKKEREQSKGHGKRTDILRRFVRAENTCQMLTGWGADARAVERDVGEIYKLAVQAEQVMVAQQGSSTQGEILNRTLPVAEQAMSVQQVNSTLVEILNRMPPAAEQDLFRASFDVEKNPSHVVLHYGSMPRVGDEDDGVTVALEAQLKLAVMGASKADDISAAVGCLGMGGVGKSCALRGLAADEDVRKRFPDGVYMVVLGGKASKVDVVKGVLDMMKRSGGRKLAQDILKDNGDVREVLSQAGVWFRSKRILLLVDDVSENNEVNSSIIEQLHRSIVSGQSRLAFTTRHVRIAAEYQIIKFGERDEVTSREMLLKAAGARAGSTGSFEDVVDRVLELCAGLPLALAIAGKIIAVRSQNSNEQSWREAWAETLTAISSRRNRLVVNQDDGYDKHSLEAALESSLETLENENGRNLGFEPKMSVHEMYRSLVIQKKQRAVPVSVLRRLWGMEDEHDVLEAMNMFVEVSLAERRSVRLNGKDTACLSLHDLQHDFVQAKCRERSEEEQHHRKMLDGWWAGAGPSRKVGRQARRDWSRSEAFDDEYMRNNVSRHLVGGGLGGELRELMRNPRWTAERLRRREVLGLEEDFGFAMASVEVKGGMEEGRRSGERERWGLEMICGAARLSASFVARNAGEVWFQLRGRLVGLAEKSGVIREFLEKIDGHAERPWARPTWACLSEPGGSVLSIVQCAGRVEDMRRGERKGELRVCGVVGGIGFMCSVVNGEMEGEEVYVNKRAEGQCECESFGDDEGVVRSVDEGGVSRECSGSYADGSTRVEWSPVLSVRYILDGSHVVTRHRNGTGRMWDVASGEAIGGTFGSYKEWCEWSVDGSRVVSGGWDGSVRIWDGASGEAVGGVEHAHSDEVTCIEWSADGSRFVSGGGDGSVRIWDGASGEVMVGECAHADYVSFVQWSAYGSRFASGGWDGSVRIWDGASGEVVGGDEYAHDGGVTCVEWSADGSRVVTGGADGSARIWDGASGEAAGGDDLAHFGEVRRVEWSADGSRVASGGRDGSMRIWDGASCKVVGGDKHAHGGGVTCVEWSSDGSRVVSGGADGSVRIWDGASGEAVGGDERAHFGEVRRVEWSADGSRVVSGGWDGSVRVWNGVGGNAVGGGEHTHSEKVSCVKWSPDVSRAVSGGWDGSIRIWDLAGGEVGDGGGRAHRRGVTCVEWSPDGSRVVSGGWDGSVRIWDGASGEAVSGHDHAHVGRVRCVEWSADGSQVVSGGWDGSVRIWDGASGETVGGDERAHGGGVTCVEWSPDGSRVVSGGWDGSVRIWGGAAGEAVGGDKRAHGGGVWHVKWAADGSRVVSGGDDGSVRIWDGASGETVGGLFCAHGREVTCVEWSADGRRFVSGGGDGSVRIWDGASGDTVGGLCSAHGRGVTYVEWSADGSRFVSVGDDGSERMWDGVSNALICTELEACETRPVRRSHSYPDVRSVTAADLTCAWDYGGEQIMRLCGEEYKVGRWVAFGRSLKLWSGGRELLVATFEADHSQMYGAEFRNMKGAVVLGLLEDRSTYFVEIVK